MRRITLRLAMAIAALVAAVAAGHNVNMYQGAGQILGVTWGTVGGCEVDYSAHGITSGCWTGERN